MPNGYKWIRNKYSIKSLGENYKCDNVRFVMAASLHSYDSYDKSCLKIMTIFVFQHLMLIVVASVKVNCSFMNCSYNSPFTGIFWILPSRLSARRKSVHCIYFLPRRHNFMTLLCFHDIIKR